MSHQKASLAMQPLKISLGEKKVKTKGQCGWTIFYTP